MGHPDWVLKQKTKGTEIRKIGSDYYLYKIRSEREKDKKRAKKITEKFLGRIITLCPPFSAQVCVHDRDLLLWLIPFR